MIKIIKDDDNVDVHTSGLKDSEELIGMLELAKLQLHYQYYQKKEEG